ncbi:MAG: creatininase family protein [Planctomycetota bacterium]|jgi:creatinine amidohydrolase|nr:creatininase family protein [Planctomycetota bacterium]
MLRSVWLNELTWEDVAEYLESRDLAILPIGSTEQHGPAAPLGVDTYAAIAVAGDAARQAGVVVAPPLWFGDSPHHLGFPGTISLRSGTLAAVVKDVVHFLARNGFRRFIFLNGHKGTNLAPLTVAGRDLLEYEPPDIQIALADPLFLCTNASEIKETGEHHACELETSHVWHKYPHLIKPDKLPCEAVDLERLFPSAIRPDLFGRPGKMTAEVLWSSRERKCFAPAGSFSDASRSSPEKSRKYHENMVANLVDFIAWFSWRERPDAPATGWGMKRLECDVLVIGLKTVPASPS